MSFNKDIKADYGAAGNGQVALTNVSITSGTNALAVSSNIFVVGDVGKAINIIGAAASGGTLKTTISTFVDPQNVTLAVTASTTLTASSQRLYWGTNDTTAFTNWRTDAQAQGTTPCVLTIPAGIYCNFSIGDFWIGVFDLTINMDGATLSEFSRGGVLPQAALGVSSARLNQVNVGDTVLSLVVPAQTSIFTVGNWVCMSSLEMQRFGYPPNWVFFEYHKIISIGTGTITIDVPASYQHLTTIPVSGDATYDMGGPATLFTVLSNWDQTVVVNGGVGGGVLDSDGQVQLIARSITVNNCTIGQQNGIDPSNSKAIILNNCTIHNVEADKALTSFTLNNCTCSNTVKFQSSSVANTYIIGGTYSTILGIGRNMAISAGCTVSTLLRLGCIGYGVPASFAAFDSSFAAIDFSLESILLSGATFANGVFTVPTASAGGLLVAGAPGTIVFWQGSGAGSQYDWGHQATVTAVWEDSTNVYLRVSPALSAAPQYAPDPDEIAGGLTTIGVTLHPAFNVTFRNCTGCVDALDLSQAGAGQPLYSYTKRTYASDAIGTTSPFINLWGRVLVIRVNVTVAASGVGPLHPLGPFGTNLFDSGNFWHRNDLNFTIDLTRTGVRVITPEGSTGAVGADALLWPSLTEPLPSPKWLWLSGGVSPYVDTVITGGSVTIEIVTRQEATDNPPNMYTLNSVW